MCLFLILFISSFSLRYRLKPRNPGIRRIFKTKVAISEYFEQGCLLWLDTPMSSNERKISSLCQEGEGATFVSCKNLGLQRNFPSQIMQRIFFMLMNVLRFEIILQGLIFYIFFFDLRKYSNNQKQEVDFQTQVLTLDRPINMINSKCAV